MEILKQIKKSLKTSINFPCSYIEGNSEKRIYIDLKNFRNKNSIISKLSTLSFSLRRQELSEGDDKNEEIYYQWNGMEHTLVLSIEYIDILPVSFESGIILS